jgi:hypothetical protein
MNAHTPGPWTAEKGPGDEWWFGGVGNTEIVFFSATGKHGQVVAVMSGNNPASSADAALIAAAPDLLAALIGMVESYEHEASASNPALLAAFAAIAAATGKPGEQA